MKNFNITIAWESPTFGKYRRMAAFLTLFALFFVGGVSAQGSCSGITYSFEHYEPCKFRARYTNTSECFIEIRYILESGTFSSWSVNSAAGFTVEVISPSELWIHHNQGFMPLGSQVPLLFTLPPDLNTTMNILYLDNCAMEGCAVPGGIPIESCPDPQNASIIGVKYRECASQPYLNQPLLSGWTIQLLGFENTLIAEQVTDVEGAYAFFDLPLGQYYVREAVQPGWTPKVPASGEYLVDLAPSQQRIANFGNCPSCSCDNIYMDVVQLPGFSDTCAYMLNVSNNDDYCFSEIDLKVAVGSFTSVTPAPGWTATMVSAKHYKLKFPPNYIPAQSFQSTFFRVTGAAQHDITVSTSWNNNGTIVTCSRPFSYQCPPPVSPLPCCPPGSMFGPELVCNPDFSLGNQCFTNDYNYFNPGGFTAIGSYSVLDYGQVYLANNQWACIDHTTYTTAGTMLVVDGYNGPIAWEQQLSVTAGTTYAFSAWFNNLVKPTLSYADPQMALWVNGNQIAATAVLLENPDRWEWLCAQYTATQTGLVTLQIRMLATTSIGNDVGIDDVSFRACIPPPSCVCLQPGAFSNMSYRPNSGPNVPISCGQIAFWQCNFPVFNLSGDFMCQGNGCPSMPPMFWTLNHPNLGQVDQGTANGTGFLISIPNASFPVSGLYTLTIAGICGMDTCYCEIIIETPGCGGSNCVCKQGSSVTVASGAASFTLLCDFHTFLPILPCPTGPVTISSDFGCVDAAGANCTGTIDWRLEYPLGNPIATGSQASALSLSLLQGLFSSPGNYYFFMETICSPGADTCRCSVTWIVECPDTCSCGNTTLQNLVTNGNFSQGNYGFTSGLNWNNDVPGACGAGNYGLYTNFSNFCNGWGPLPDHTTGTGLFLNLDGFFPGLGNGILWQSQVMLMPQSDYCFSFWWALGFAHPLQNFNVSVDILDASGNVLLNLGLVNIANSTTWTNFGSPINWNSGTLAGNYFIAIRQLTPSDFRDWGIDDICLTKIPSVCECREGDLTYSTAGSTVNMPCNSPNIPVFFCPTGPVTISGVFGCVDPSGAPCVPTSPIDWTLYHNGIVQQGTILSGSPWTLPFTAADLAGSGYFTMYMTTLCPGQVDSCKCVVTWFQECIQDSCVCGPNPWANEFRYGGAQNIPVPCGQTISSFTTGSVFYPNFQCDGPPGCGRVDWSLTGPPGYTTQSMIGVIPNSAGGFAIPPVQPTNFTIPGIYCLQMLGICDQDTCPCVVYFCLEPPPPIVNDDDICRTLQSVYVPLVGCPTDCDIAQVEWYVKPCSATNWPPTPYQISSAGTPQGCDDLLFLPYLYAGETCVQVYAVVKLDPGCCVPDLTSNVATITLCNPISCTITNPNPVAEYCQCGTPQLPLTVNPINANCNYTVQWYHNGQIIQGATGLTYQPGQLCFQQNAASNCWFDHVFTAQFTGECGTSSCSTTIRVYDPNAPVGTLDMVPFEPQPFCPGEDARLIYDDECAGEPPKWTWYSSTVDPPTFPADYTPIPLSGNMNPTIYTNQLYQTTWYLVEKQNGVCPKDQVDYRIEVKAPITITNFTAIPDPCVDSYVALTVHFTPTPITGTNCQYVVDWYYNGNLIHTSVALGSPVSYTYPSPTPGQGSLAGVYYAVVRDNCCPGSAQTFPIVLDPTCVPGIDGPCYVCDKTTQYTLTGAMILPPQDPCPFNPICTYTWYQLDITTGNWVQVGTGLSFTTTCGGHFRFESICDYGYGPCIRNAYHDVAQCVSTGTGCMYVDAPEVILPIGMEVEIHPNPTTGSMTVQISPVALRKGRVEVVDVNGKMLAAERIPENQASHTMYLGHLPNGIYFVRVFESDVLVWVGKIVRSE